MIFKWLEEDVVINRTNCLAASNIFVNFKNKDFYLEVNFLKPESFGVSLQFDYVFAAFKVKTSIFLRGNQLFERHTKSM